MQGNPVSYVVFDSQTQRSEISTRIEPSISGRRSEAKFGVDRARLPILCRSGTLDAKT